MNSVNADLNRPLGRQSDAVRVATFAQTSQTLADLFISFQKAPIPKTKTSVVSH